MNRSQMDAILNQYESDEEGYDQIDSDDVDSDCEHISRFVFEAHKHAPIVGVMRLEGQLKATQMKVENPFPAVRFYESTEKQPHLQMNLTPDKLDSLNKLSQDLLRDCESINSEDAEDLYHDEDNSNQEEDIENKDLMTTALKSSSSPSNKDSTDGEIKQYCNTFSPLHDTLSCISNDLNFDPFYSQDEFLDIQIRSYSETEKDLEASNKIKFFDLHKDEGEIKPESSFTTTEKAKSKANF